VKFINYTPGEIIHIPGTGSWKSTPHEFEEEGIWAINAALAAERPLLIRGLPGTGKSQLARAAAAALNRLFIYHVVRAGTGAQDLQYHYDAVARLGDAQTLACRAKISNVEKELAPSNYLSPGPLWWTFDWGFADEVYEKGSRLIEKPERSDDWHPEQGVVLLIDEIDKADADLPNGLLEILGNGSFSVPYLNRAVGSKEGSTLPLVIITTNEERELPSAFVRRCMVLHLELPEKDGELIDFLVKRGEVHFSKLRGKKVMQRSAQMLAESRTQAKTQGLPLPGQAEYLDMLRAIDRLESDMDPMKVLDHISCFCLKKKKADV
jgi:MoxR-like ATPase